jgi:hypothetical protein
MLGRRVGGPQWPCARRLSEWEAYDFRAAFDLGRESLATRKPDDALAWFEES